MFKVECESCKAPYQIDERRVPPNGLKMRCPKCGHSFVVNVPGTSAGSAMGGAPQTPAQGGVPQKAGVETKPKGPPPVPAPHGFETRPKGPPPVPAPRAKPPGAVAAAWAKGPPPPGASASTASASTRGSPPPGQRGEVSAAARAAAPPDAGRVELPSDFPAALGSLDESDLPIVSADLPSTRPRPSPPAARPQAPAKAPRPAADLPVAASSARDAKRGPGEGDLPSVVPDLPVVGADLPAPAGRSTGRASLPAAAAAGLSARAQASRAGAGLPAPHRGAGRDFGELDLPSVADALPVATDALPVAADALLSMAEALPVVADALPLVAQAPAPSPARRDSAPAADARELEAHAGFGEIDLPREMPPSSRNPPSPRPAEPGHADDLQLDDAPGPRRSGSTSSAPRRDSIRTDGGMGFGEVDLRNGRSDPPSVGIEALPVEPGDPSGRAAATSWNPPAPAATPAASRRASASPAARRKTSRGLVITLLVLAALLTAGAALQLTPYGAYGYLVATDLVRAGRYARTTAQTMKDVEAILGPDTYDAAKRAVARAYGAHAGLRRAKALTAYAALIDAAVTVRFGPDASRASRANQLLAELPGDRDIPFRSVAAAAQAAGSGELERAATALEAAGRRAANDPVRLDRTLLEGDIQLALGKPAAALAAFKVALSLSNDARCHFGLARAYDALGDAPDAKKEIDATLAASPEHAGALTLRARRRSESVDSARALADLAEVIDGPVRRIASPHELSDAYAARAWVQLERGRATEAGDALAAAVNLNPSNVAALNGQGRLLLDEGRYAEALARFDTALGLSPSSPATIANDAEAKLDLERLEDAKQQLVAARDRFPDDVGILLLLGRAERHLGNDDAAEANLRAAIAHVDPGRVDGVKPYVALCELQSARGRLNEARATLEDAKKKLPPSPALDRAFGDFDELQGSSDEAIAYYRAAISKEPRDAAAHFQLAVALRRLRRFDEASSELDKVAAVDRDYPGMVLERGLLFEDSGDVTHAIEQFNDALSKAPDDPDLQLRVGGAYVAIGRPDDALPMLRKVLEKRPNSAEANHYIGRALMLRGGAQLAEALRYLRRAADLDPQRAEFHVYVAWAANESAPAQLELAHDEVDRALALDKLSAEAYWQRGILERMEGAVDDAVKDEKHALQLRPTRYEAHATLAECYEDKNDEADAVAEWQRALAGDGQPQSSDVVAHPFWHYRYGKLLKERGALQAALAQLLPAAATAEKMDGRPVWLAPLEFLTAEALRGAAKRAEAAEHYQRFLEIAPVNSPDRYDAQNALEQLGRRQ